MIEILAYGWQDDFTDEEKEWYGDNDPLIPCEKCGANSNNQIIIAGRSEKSVYLCSKCCNEVIEAFKREFV